MTGQTLFVPQIIALSSLPHSSEQTVLAEGSFFYFRRAEELTRITNNSVFSRSVPKEQRALLISVIVLQHRSLRGNRRFKIMFIFLQRASLFMTWREMLLFQYIFCKRCVLCCSTDADSITTNNKLPISNILPCQVSLRKSKKSVFVSENNSLRSLRNATLVRDLIVKIPLMLTHRD